MKTEIFNDNSTLTEFDECSLRGLLFFFRPSTINLSHFHQDETAWNIYFFVSLFLYFFLSFFFVY